MAIYVIIAIIAVILTALIAVPVTANITVKKKDRKRCRNHWNRRGQSEKHYR
nr:hypothetical protein [Blautia hansenii]